jgi:predicted DNA-binding ribbon-helix-helix protein
MQNRSPSWKHALAAVRDFTALISRNDRSAACLPSFRPDPLTWSALQEIALREDVTVHELCGAIDEVKPSGVTLTAAIRVAVLRYFMDATTKAEQQHPKPH